MQASTWVEVSEEALRTNLRKIREYLAVPICAVVKANGYGHGLVGAARIFAAAGAEMVGVARLEEAEAIRREGIDAPLLLLMPTYDASRAGALGCRLTAASPEDLVRLPPASKVHLKVDTGMGRLGFPPEEALEAARRVEQSATLEAVWTHFPSLSSARRRLDALMRLREDFQNAGFECRFHAANSAAAVRLPDSRLDMVRLGTLLYGENLTGSDLPFPLHDAFAWYARVVSVREIPAGSTVGYGSEFRARKPIRIATLPVGFADGLTVQPLGRSETVPEAIRVGGGLALLALGRRPSQRAVYFGETPAPMIGRIAMQAITVSLEGLDEIDVGSIGRLPARRLLVNPGIERVYV